MDRGVHFGGARDQRQRIARAGVQPLPFHRNGAFSHLQRREVARRVKLRFTGRQRSIRRVDKAAAITGDAIRVGDHHIRRFPRHFGITLQPGTAAAGDFVDNAARFLACAQVRVVLDKPAQLRLCKLTSGVIED